MSDNFINVSKSTFLILRMVIMTLLQLIIAILRLKIDVLLVDIKICISLSLSLILLWSEYIICIGILIGVSLRQDEEQFNTLYNKYQTYFNELYLKLDKGVRQMYSIDQIVNCKVNI